MILQFLGEALFLSVMAGIAAVILMVLTLPAFNALMQKQLSPGWDQPSHFLALLLIIGICGLVAGSYPSFYLSSFRPVLVLKGMKLKGGGAALIRQALVVTQFAVSVVFIICTIIVYRQLQHVKNRPLGFEKDNLLEIDMQHDISGNFLSIKQDLMQTGVVQNAALSDHITINGGNSDNRFTWQGKLPDNETSITFRNVSPGFIATSGMKIVEGRDFSMNAGAESSHVIISRSLEKMMGKDGAVGKIIRSPRGNPDGMYTDMTIVGVVGDYVYGNIYGQAAPVLFFCQKGQMYDNLLYVRIRPRDDMSTALAKIEAVIKKDNPAYPFEYKFVDDQFNQLFQNETLIGKVAGVFAALAIFISCLGLFGLATYTAQRRTREMAIRKVLGAGITGLAGLLSAEFLQLVFISCLIAFPLAWWIMHSWLQQYEYRIPINGWEFIAAGVLASLIALGTISWATHWYFGWVSYRVVPGIYETLEDCDCYFAI